MANEITDLRRDRRCPSRDASWGSAISGHPAARLGLSPGRKGRGWRLRIGPYVIVCGATGGCADASPSRSNSSIASISTLVGNGFASTFAAPMSLAMWR